MRYLLDEALEQGAWGYSTGLEYAAERGADEDELVAMCEVCGTAPRHVRNAHATPRRGRRRGRRRGAPRRASARACGCRSPTSFRGTGSSRRGAASSSSTRPPRRGMDVAFDMHTRLYGTTFLLAALPPSALEDPARLREMLAKQRAATRVAELREHPQRRRRLEPDRPSRQRRLARVRAARRGRRSPPSATRIRSTPSTTCCSELPTIPGS